jgi:hypothetical protein
MSQTVGRVRNGFSLPIAPFQLLYIYVCVNSLTISLPDPPRLLPCLAPRLPRLRRHPSPRPPGLAHRRPAHGQTQAHLRPLDRLWRLRGRHVLHRSPRHGQEDAAENVLPAHDAAGQPQAAEHGGHDEEVGRGGDIKEGGQGHAAEEQAEGPEAGEAEGWVCPLLPPGPAGKG